MVGGEDNKILESMWFNSLKNNLKAYPMNIYRDGKQIGINYQKSD